MYKTNQIKIKLKTLYLSKVTDVSYLSLHNDMKTSLFKRNLWLLKNVLSLVCLKLPFWIHNVYFSWKWDTIIHFLVFLKLNETCLILQKKVIYIFINCSGLKTCHVTLTREDVSCKDVRVDWRKLQIKVVSIHQSFDFKFSLLTFEDERSSKVIVKFFSNVTF